MNQKTVHRMQTRDLGRRVAHARFAMTQQMIERETAIRRDGIAHPRTIRASRRLRRTGRAYRGLLTSYRVRASEDAHTSRRAGRGA